jgi:hypothetical protein
MSKGVKFDSGKPRLGLIDPSFLEDVAHVLGYGEDKYGGPNWMNGIEYSRVIDAAKRHIAAFECGEEIDAETNRSHLAHATCCMMFLHHYTHNNFGGFDDRRYKKDLLEVQGRKGIGSIFTESGEEEILDLQEMRKCGSDPIAAAQERIKSWADRVYPGRTPHGALAKLMLEEIPELLNGGLDDPGEYADTLILLFDIAQMRGIDALQAVHDKMEINENRTWVVDPQTGIMRHK